MFYKFWCPKRKKRNKPFKVKQEIKKDLIKRENHESEMESSLRPIPFTWEYHFHCHMSQYLGQTVTIFVNSGGVSGMGFTGTLLKVNPQYLSLISQFGPSPDGCFGWDYHPGHILSLGSVTHIPISKIISFVHHAV